MNDAPPHCRLVTFLGTGNYQSVIYRDPASGCCAPQTTWIARALAELHRPTEIVVLATKKAEATHGTALRADLGGAGFTIELRTIDEGGEPQHLWQQFEAIKAALRAPAEWQVILDITHGFRSQPFFAASVVAFVRAVDENPPPLRVVYGGFEAKDSAGVAPIWDLTPFIDLLDWTREIMLFLKTGRGAGVAEKLKEVSELADLGSALQRFGRDLETIRTGSLLLGTATAESSAHALAHQVETCRQWVHRTLPPFADILHLLEQKVRQLLVRPEPLNSPDAHKALVNLAQWYVEMGRYVEATTAAQEGWISLYADGEAAFPGRAGCTNDERKAASGRWFAADKRKHSKASHIRNDIDHGGYRPKPADADAVIANVSSLVADFRKAARKEPKPKPAAGCTPVFVNISNHPSAEWEDAQRQAALAYAPTILDIPFPAVAPSADPGAVATLRDALLEQVPAGTTHAMVQGEFTLAFALVRELSSRGILCLAATTEREVIDLANGETQRRFRFVRFRSYGC